MNYMVSKPSKSTGVPRKVVSAAAYLGLCLVWIGTVSFSIAANAVVNTSRIKLTATQLHVVDVAVALPGLLIWLSILFAGLSIGHYARVIKGSKEAPGFKLIAWAIFVLLAGLIVASYLGNIQGFVSQHASDPEKVKTPFIIASNYVSVVSALVTYGLLLQGARLLLRGIGKQLDVAKKLLPMAVVFAVVTAAYLWLIHGNPVRQTSAQSSINPTFGLSYLLTVFTVALPFVVSWFIGVLALIGLYQYRQKTAGIVYKMLFRKLFIGLSLFIGTNIALQLLIQMYSLYANGTLSFILGLIAFVFVVLLYAFVLVAQGARRLNTIETAPTE